VEKHSGLDNPQELNAMEEVTDVDLAWLAGMIDGEGNISAGVRLNPNGASYLEVKVRISGNDIRMMHAIGVIYRKMNLVFFNSLMNKNSSQWKTGLNVEVAKQGSTLKLLTAVKPYLRGKAETAQSVIDIINYVKSVPRSGNGVRRNYATHPEFTELMERYKANMTWYFDPSTTTRKAREPISLDGIV
jgi:hypothetical protein